MAKKAAIADASTVNLLHVLIVILILIGIITSAMTFLEVKRLEEEVKVIRDTVIPQSISVEDFLAKMTAHDDAKRFVGVSPLNIVQVNNNNFANLQTQITGLDVSYLDSFLVQYTDMIVVYDYDNDEIKGFIQLQSPQQQFAQDFEAKLYAHPEVSLLRGQQLTGGQLDEPTLVTLQQQFPEVYKNAKPGDFLLRYETHLILYDFQNDKLVNIVQLQ